ncbi:MAG: hypothetical protein JKY65_14310 [Planctomycetes bacterium]|nr:hypothetical protein [Planctomycetota bacterium]
MAGKLLFLNSHRAKSGIVDGQRLPAEYVLLAKVFGCGPLDRTQTLDMGLEYEILDELPTDGNGASFEAVCEQVADGIVSDALANDQAIQLAWSGGIDSTVALISIVARLIDRGELERLTVLLSLDSIREYPRFYAKSIQGKLRTEPLPIPIPTALREDALTVTGEHGDQLFGSDHLADLVKSGLAQRPYADVLPLFFFDKLGCTESAKRLMEYLAPQVEKAPVPISTAFDFIWWCNFSLKWQQVALRIPAFRRGAIEPFVRTTRHFFGDPRFQAWSLSNPQVRRIQDWRAYKLEAKKVILDATGDFEYFVGKEKAPSLKRVLVDRRRQGRDRYRVHMYDDYQVELEVFQIKNRGRAL